METQNKEHLLGMLGASFMELPLWKKTVTVMALTMMSPWLAVIAVLVGVAAFPFLLFGRWEGELGERPLVHEAKHLLRRQRQRTVHYYAEV